MSPHSAKEIATTPSGHVGVYRAADGWEAVVAEPARLKSLGVFATKREAVAARAKYWRGKERGPEHA